LDKKFTKKKSGSGNGKSSVKAYKNNLALDDVPTVPSKNGEKKGNKKKKNSEETGEARKRKRVEKEDDDKTVKKKKK